jgi:cytochrome P450
MPVTTEASPAHVARDLVFDVDIGGATAEDMLRHPFEVWSRLKSLPPVFWALRAPLGMREGGCWTVTGAAAIRDMMQDPEHFSNERGRQEYGGGGGVQGLIPLFMDPPDHGKYRALLAPIFSPRSIDTVEKNLYGLSKELIDAFADKGECDFMEAYARPFPVTVFMSMMGLPLEERAQFIEWEHQIFQGGTPEKRMLASMSVAKYLRDLIEEKRRNPADDIVSKLVASQVDGQPIAQDKLEGMCMLLYMAGLDTVAAGLGHTLRYLAENPALQARLRAAPELIPDAIEESLRFHSWIPTGRLCVKEIDFHGARIMPGDWVQAIFYGASHDEAEQPQSSEFLVPREPNRHFAFGAGVHRCAGSHLARRELRIAVRMLLERLGEFRIKPGADLRYDGGLVCLGALPLEWEPKV